MVHTHALHNHHAPLMSLLQPAQCLLTSDSSRSIAFDAGLTCVGSKGPSFEQQGQLTAPDAAILSVRHVVHTSALHINSSGCERTLAHIAHFSSSKIDRLFTLAKGGLAHARKLLERQSSEDELLVC